MVNLIQPKLNCQPMTDSTRGTPTYEALDHEGLVQFAKEELNRDLSHCDTQTILHMLRHAQNEQASQVGLTWEQASVIVLDGTPFKVGGGWHLISTTSQPRGTKRASDPSDNPAKRQRTSTTNTDTATVSKTDEEVQYLGTRFEHVGTERQSGNPDLHPARLPRPDAQASPTLLDRYLEAADHDAETANRNAEATPSNQEPDYEPQSPGIKLIPPLSLDNSQTHIAPDPSNDDTRRMHRGTQWTYMNSRTHLPPMTSTPASMEDPSNSPEPPARPNSPSLTAAELIQKERARAIAAKMDETCDHLHRPSRPHRLFAEASHPPTTRPQARLAPGASSNAALAHIHGPRPLDPMSTARADMIAFNEAVARGNATSLVESVTRQSNRQACREPPASRQLNELLDDDEEMIAQAEAYAQKKWPPLARDVSGIQRQVLIIAKLHLFAYALVEGIYQTRATFLRWAAAVYEATWQMELPTTPMIEPDEEILEIMVNSIATLRGRVKEHLRPFAANAAQFQQNVIDQCTIQENLRRFNLLYPNNFHCKTHCPRHGHYENPEIGHCMAAALFSGPNSVGMLFPEYFRDMPLTVVAFVLAIWQFCIEEWSNGWHKNASLGAGAMRDKFEAQLAGLKDLRDVAPRRMAHLQEEWRKYVTEYSGAAFETSEEVIYNSLRSEMRPDTPEPGPSNAMDVDELEARLFETARQQSLREQMRDIIASEEADNEVPMDEDGMDHEVEQNDGTSTPEYNEQGIQTAQSKGKGHAN
ncbi:hypothetical protein CTheo_8399 [Ceratobasidium theobromae]|uniref:DUF6532 domain-containing protein n=1 Tax=Ceratobasidium theobromae TaxID=1582974 RepID=A0A5N5Q8P5_9AGAM|nr:hypothetical protein CTheo_8399 [Ceratobasidium theobromae]